MHEIYDRLYVGGNEDYEKVKNRSGWSYLRCCKFGPDGHKDILGYTTQAAPDGPDKYIATKGKNLTALNILDLDDPTFMPWDAIEEGLRFVKGRLEHGDKVLIACNSGHSRGPTVGMMFLRAINDLPYHFVKAEHIYKTLYPQYDPGIGMRQLARSKWTYLDNLLEKQ